MSPKTPKYDDNRDELHPDHFHEPDQAPAMRRQHQSGFNLPANIRAKMKAGFVPIEFRGKISLDRLEEATNFGHYKINLHDYPELKNKVYDEYMFGDTKADDGEMLPYRYGGQVCMGISPINYNYMQNVFTEERQRLQAIVDKHRVENATSINPTVKTHYIS